MGGGGYESVCERVLIGCVIRGCVRGLTKWVNRVPWCATQTPPPSPTPTPTSIIVLGNGFWRQQGGSKTVRVGTCCKGGGRCG